MQLCDLIWLPGRTWLALDLDTAPATGSGRLRWDGIFFKEMNPHWKVSTLCSGNRVSKTNIYTFYQIKCIDLMVQTKMVNVSWAQVLFIILSLIYLVIKVFRSWSQIKWDRLVLLWEGGIYEICCGRLDIVFAKCRRPQGRWSSIATGTDVPIIGRKFARCG